MTFRILTALVLGVPLLLARAVAAEPPVKITEGKDSLRAASGYLEVEVSLTQPQLMCLAVDSLGRGHFQPGTLRPPAAAPRPTTAKRTGTTLEYGRPVRCCRLRPAGRSHWTAKG